MTNRSAATRYARALFDVALKEGADLQAIEAELAVFSGLFTQFPELKQALLNPAVPTPRKRGAAADLVKLAGISSIPAKLLALLAERDRLVLVPDLLAAYRERLLDHQRVVRAELTTSSSISDERADEIRQTLSRATGRTVILATRVDPSIIGGLVARVGSVVYDASVTTQLQKMKERLQESV